MSCNRKFRIVIEGTIGEADHRRDLDPRGFSTPDWEERVDALRSFAQEIEDHVPGGATISRQTVSMSGRLVHRRGKGA